MMQTLKSFMEKRRQGLNPDIETSNEEIPMPVTKTVVRRIQRKETIDEHRKDTLSRAKILAKFAGIEFKARELVDEWILVTYDLPATEEGNKARQDFLRLAPRIGAVMHTKSVYLMPNTNECQTATVDLAKIGNVFIWTSKPNSEASKKELTDLYDAKIKAEIKKLEDRTKQIRKNMANEKNGMANRMIEKTIDIFNNSVFSAIQRGNADIYNKLVAMRDELQELQHEVESKV
jgi:hypothetical protein